jgi:uncharacterized protein YkwD
LPADIQGIGSMRHRAKLAGAIAAVIAAAAVAFTPVDGGGASGAKPSAVAVDAAAAARMITQYRASHGLAAVKVEARLTRIATVHSERMAAADRLDHVLPGEGSFQQRIESGGYTASVAAENIAAGLTSLASAIAGWEDSPSHNANLLNPSVTEIGIALYSTPTGRYHTYWTLVLARPAPPPSASPPFSVFNPFGG